MGSESMRDPDVFISYSSKNPEIANAVVSYFESNGIQCWYAPRNIVPGKEWVPAIKEGLRRAKVFVLLYTPESNQSRQVMNEVALAFNANMTMVPFILTSEPMNDELEYYLTRVHWLDATTIPLGEGIKALYTYVSGAMEKTKAPEEPKAEVQGVTEVQGAGAAQDVTEAVTAGAAQDMSEVPTSGAMQGVAEAMTAGAAQDVTEAVTAGAAQDMSEAVTSGAVQDMSEVPTSGTAQDVAGAMSAKAVQGVTEAQDLAGAAENWDAAGTAQAQDGALAAQAETREMTPSAAEKEEAITRAVSAAQEAALARKEENKEVRVGNCAPKVEKKIKPAVWIGLAAGMIVLLVVGILLAGKPGGSGKDKLMAEGYEALYSGLDSAEEDAKAKEIYEAAAKKGAADAYYFLAQIYEREYDFKSAKRVLEEGIEAGSDLARLGLGNLYQNGLGTEANIDKAWELYNEAADNGCVEADYYMAKIYIDGLAGQQADAEKGVRLLKNVAEETKIPLFKTRAYVALGNVYRLGRIGVPRDLEKAVATYQKIADVDDYSGARRTMEYDIGLAYRAMDEQVKARDHFRAAVEVVKERADAGSIYDMFWYGWCYRYGYGVEISMEEAIRWYEAANEAAKAKNPNARCFEALKALGDAYAATGDYEKALVAYGEASDYGYGVAANAIGDLYFNGYVGVDEDGKNNFKLAKQWYDKALEHGCTDAYCSIGNIYYSGEGVPEDKDEALNCFLKGAYAGSGICAYNVAVVYYNQDKAEEALPWYLKAADLEYEKAYVVLGLYYEQGMGTAKDMNKAIEWYEKAAQEETDINLMAIQSLTEIYYEGSDDAMINYEKALRWAKEGDALGDAYCSYVMGMIYCDDTAGFLDVEAGMEAFLRAAQRGKLEAQYLYGYLRLTGEYGIGKNESEGEEWLTKYSENANSEKGILAIAQYYYESKDYRKAFNYYKQLADQSSQNPEVWYRISRLYSAGVGVSYDSAKALQYLEMAYYCGMDLSADEYAELAFAYYNGDTFYADVEKHYTFVKLAALGGNGVAMEFMGYYCQMGLSALNVPINYQEALRWYSAALDSDQLDDVQVDYCKERIRMMVDSGHLTEEETQKWL